MANKNEDTSGTAAASSCPAETSVQGAHSQLCQGCRGSRAGAWPRAPKNTHPLYRSAPQEHRAERAMEPGTLRAKTKGLASPWFKASSTTHQPLKGSLGSHCTAMTSTGTRESTRCGIQLAVAATISPHAGPAPGPLHLPCSLPETSLPG